jgi:DNA adenine methylase
VAAINKTDNLKPVLRYPGAKWMLSDWIIDNLPPHKTYLEPYFGSGAVFFNKKPCKVETINDIDSRVTNLFEVVRTKPRDLAKLIEMTPWSREEYYASYEHTGDNLEDARRFLVRCWQAHGTTIGTRAGWRNDIQGIIGAYYPKQWATLPDRILSIVERLKSAQIENRPAVQLIQAYNFEHVLIYADPPYPMSVRSVGLYSNNMTDAEHIEMIEALKQHSGAVVLSGYDCELYREHLHGWVTNTSRSIANGGRDRVETLWLNPKASTSLSKMSLFDGVGLDG